MPQKIDMGCCQSDQQQPVANIAPVVATVAAPIVAPVVAPVASTNQAFSRQKAADDAVALLGALFFCVCRVSLCCCMGRT